LFSFFSSAMVLESNFFFWQRHGVGGAAAAGRNLEAHFL